MVHVLVFCLLVALVEGKLDVIPRDDVFVLYHNSSELRAADGAHIVSDFPISSLRHDDLNIDQPIGVAHMTIVVSSDCSDLSIAVEDQVGDDGGRTIAISRNTSARGTDVPDVDNLSFLEPISFSASWTYAGGCDWVATTLAPTKTEERSNIFGAPKEEEEDVNNRRLKAEGVPKRETWSSETIQLTRSGALVTKPPSRVDSNRGAVTMPPNRPSVNVPTIPPPTDPPVNTPTLSSTRPPVTGAATTCRVNVDIYHNGCRWSNLTVNAPVARVIDVVLENRSQNSTKVDNCNTIDAETDVTFPTDNEVVIDTDNTSPESLPVTLPQLPEECGVWAYGRPFVDQSGHAVAASILPSEELAQACDWSATADVESPLQETKSNETDREQREAFGEEWTKRALGEHSSVASFAAFTIALMSNNAPPDLIQDALAAAQDEVRHAKVSFEAASLFGGVKPVEPGPLPPSSHEFKYNLTALAFATAHEGCIHETLSALIMAIEVDEQLDQMKWLTSKERTWLNDKMTVIAKEEASHSALAWRTIGWICGVDEGACETVQTAVLESRYLQQVGQQRILQDHESLLPVAGKIARAWFELYSMLVPLTTKRGEKDTVHDACGTNQNAHYEGEIPTPLASSVTLLLMQNVCRHMKEGMEGLRSYQHSAAN